jgi:uncharacterized SAM-binding protein YcdF (DUF218 family)
VPRGWGLWLGVALAAAAVYAFLDLGRFMAYEDPLQPADAIVVLAGTRAERQMEGADLYLAKYAPVVVVTRADSEIDALRELETRGVRLVRDHELDRELLIGLGVPAEALIIPDRLHDNTGDEARTLRELAVARGWRRLIVVSSKYHLRRAAMAFRRALRGTDVDVIARGTRYDQSTPDRWWRRRGDIRFLAWEVPKFVAYAVGLGG